MDALSLVVERLSEKRLNRDRQVTSGRLDCTTTVKFSYARISMSRSGQVFHRNIRQGDRLRLWQDRWRNVALQAHCHSLLRSCVLIAFCLAWFGSSQAFCKQPNIVFIFTDDLGWGDLGVFHQNHSTGMKKHKTPELDRLASAGIQMRAHYCPAPVCAPSRSSLLTGVHQGNAVVRNNQFDKALEDNHTLGSVLRQAGYRTCMIGKYGLQGGPKERQQDGTPDDWPSYPTKRGFDEYFGYVSHYAGHLHYPNDPWVLANEGHQGVPNLWMSDPTGDYEISESLSKCYTTDLFTARAKYFVKNHVAKRGDQPFFLMLNFDTPHAALQVPTMAYPEGNGIVGGLQWTGGDNPNAISQPAINTATGVVDAFLHPDYAEQDWSDVEKRFATMVRRIDSAVADLNTTLTQLGIAENTLVVFTSDNGPHQEAYLAGESWGSASYSPEAFQSYGPFDGIKRDCWEGGIRMPSLAWWPGTIHENRIDSTPSQFHDWMATFCELAQIPAPARCDGVSVVPTLIGKGEQLESTVYIEYENNGKTPGFEDFLKTRRNKKRKEMQVIRVKGGDGKSYKGVRYNIESATDKFEIYDVDNDPKEAMDLAGTSPAMQDLQLQMQARVLQVRSPNDSAKRPYDKALIPSVVVQPRLSVRRIELPEKVDYVPSLQAQAAELMSDAGIESGDGQFSFVAPTEGVFEIRGSFDVVEAGAHTIDVQSDAACFMRLHASHAIDLQKAGKQSSSERMLAEGSHPFKITIRVEEVGSKTIWTLRK